MRAMLIAILVCVCGTALAWQLPATRRAMMMDATTVAAAGGGGTLGNSLILHYLLNDNAANTVVDNTRTNIQDGTADTNTDNLSRPGKINLAFTNDSTYQVTTYITNQVENVTHSVSFWMKKNSGNSRIWGAVNYGYAWTHVNDTLYCSIYDAAGSGGVLYTAVLTNSGNSAWHHYVLVTDWGTSNSVLWFDGTNRSNLITYTQKYTNPQRDLSESYLIGHCYSGAQKMNGVMDDFRVYTRVVTTNEVLQLYNGGAGTEDE